jgi:hypothetical protein
VVSGCRQASRNEAKEFVEERGKLAWIFKSRFVPLLISSAENTPQLLNAFGFG